MLTATAPFYVFFRSLAGHSSIYNPSSLKFKILETKMARSAASSALSFVCKMRPGFRNMGFQYLKFKLDSISVLYDDRTWSANLSR